MVDKSEKITNNKNDLTIKKEYSIIPATRKHLVFKSKDKNRVDRRLENNNNYKCSNHLLMIAPTNVSAKNIEQTIKTEIIEEIYRNECEDPRSLIPTTQLTNIVSPATVKFHKQQDNTFSSALSVNKFEGPIMFKNNFLSVQIDIPKVRSTSLGDNIDKKLFCVDNGQHNFTNDCVASIQCQRNYDTNLVSVDNSYHHVKSGSRTKKKNHNKSFSNEKRKH